jgi:hypothetical protein
MNEINSNIGKEIPYSSESGTNGEEYQYSLIYTGAPKLITEDADSDYKNSWAKQVNEKLFPIGKGWSWNIPYVEMKDNSKFIHLEDGSVYEIEGIKLKGYIWDDLTFSTDTSVNNSQYSLKTLDGKNYYFNNDGYLIVIVIHMEIKLSSNIKITYNMELLLVQS